MLAFGSIVVAIVLLISVVFFLNAQRNAVTNAKEGNEKVLTGAMERVDDLHNVITQVSFYVASDPVLRGFLREFPSDPVEQIAYQNRISQFLTQFWLNRPEVVGICVYLDRAEGVSTSTVGVSTTRYLKDQGWLDLIGQTRGVIINGHARTFRTGIPLASLSLVKILDFDESLLGYISFEVSNRNLYPQILSSQIATRGSILFAVDEDWKIISHADPSMIGTDAGSAYPQCGGGKTLVRIGNRRMILAMGEPNMVKWRAIEFIPLGEIFDGWTLAGSLALFSLCALCLALILVSVMSVRITKPIVALSSMMSAKDPLKAVLPAAGKAPDEIGRLFGSYGELIRKQNRLIQELESVKEAEKEAELHALRAQMNPHFMCNTLDYINWRAQDGDLEGISRMLTLLSNFLRLSLGTATMKGLLGAELEHAKAYLAIFSARYGGSFRYAIEADESLYACEVPQFILQPLLENSIIHGFGREVRDAVITIRIHQRGCWLVFDISDNGRGMSRDRLRGILEGTESPSGKGYGIRNVDERMRNICGLSGYSGFSLVPQAEGTRIHFELKLSADHGGSGDAD